MNAILFRRFAAVMQLNAIDDGQCVYAENVSDMAHQVPVEERTAYRIVDDVACLYGFRVERGMQGRKIKIILRTKEKP